MTHDAEVYAFLLSHLQAIQENDIESYHTSTSEDLSLYEWWVTPHRIDGLPFHDFMMEANARRGTVFGADQAADEETRGETRFDLSHLRIQRYAETAVASYTLLTSTATPKGVQVNAHNESRVMVKIDGEWQVIHVHKSPAWNAPHVAPESVSD